MSNSDIQQQIEELRAEVEQLKVRLTEDETVIASLQAWIQYSFGILLKHLPNPDADARSHISHLIEWVFEDMYRKLKVGYRGEGELEVSRDGFDRLYICALETAGIWKSMRDHNFAKKSDDRGYKLLNVGLDMLNRLEPQYQKCFPVETRKEKQFRKQIRDQIIHLRDNPPGSDK